MFIIGLEFIVFFSENCVSFRNKIKCIFFNEMLEYMYYSFHYLAWICNALHIDFSSVRKVFKLFQLFQQYILKYIWYTFNLNSFDHKFCFDIHGEKSPTMYFFKCYKYLDNKTKIFENGKIKIKNRRYTWLFLV